MTKNSAVEYDVISPRQLTPSRSTRNYKNHANPSRGVNLGKDNSVYDVSASDMDIGRGETKQELKHVDDEANTTTKYSNSDDFMDISGDGLAIPTTRSTGDPRSFEMEERIMLQNPGTFSTEINELAAQYLQVSSLLIHSCIHSTMTFLALTYCMFLTK